jgi:Cu/Ag efflux pump CusA
MRPIAMTTFVAIVALMTLALGIGQGAAMQQPLRSPLSPGLWLSFRSRLSSCRRCCCYSALHEKTREQAFSTREDRFGYWCGGKADLILIQF